jgi:hypothetical protein
MWLPAPQLMWSKHYAPGRFSFFEALKVLDSKWPIREADVVERGGQRLVEQFGRADEL